jgi:hypothetical protein
VQVLPNLTMTDHMEKKSTGVKGNDMSESVWCLTYICILRQW